MLRASEAKDELQLGLIARHIARTCLMGAVTISADLVRANTTPEALRKIDDEIEQRVRFYSAQPTEVVSRRIAELDREWDIERVLETNASALALTSLVLGLTVSRKYLLITGTVMGFLLMHSLQGWCPPMPVLRKLGVRTRAEIDREKYALKAIRGDFTSMPGPVIMPDTAAEALSAVNKS